MHTLSTNPAGLSFPSSKPMKSFASPVTSELMYEKPNVFSMRITDFSGIDWLNNRPNSKQRSFLVLLISISKSPPRI